MNEINKILKKYNKEDIFSSCDTFSEMVGNLLYFYNTEKLNPKESEVLYEYFKKYGIK